MAMDRAQRRTIPVKIGSMIIGGGFPVSIQTMWKEPLLRVDSALVSRVENLADLGCELLRFAVPDLPSAELLGELAGQVRLPLVADIHFDHRIAMRCLDLPIAKIRINPGNIGTERKAEEVIRKAADRGVPLRIGVNAGSLPASLREEADPVTAMIRAAELELDLLVRHGFRQAIFSLKSSDVRTTVEANRGFAAKYDYPLHLGVTEAGPLIPGLVKNTMAMATLLQEGVGDTVRVSLSDTPENEVLAARAILQHSGARSAGAELISCPTCGRTPGGFDIKKLVNDVNNILHTIHQPITVAIMGCPVNGPGEARRADLGIAGAGENAIIFKKGEVIRRVKSADALKAFLEELERL